MTLLSHEDFQKYLISAPAEVSRLVMVRRIHQPSPDLCCRLPAEARRLYALATAISAGIDFGQAPTIWIADTSVWSEEEDLDLFRGYLLGNSPIGNVDATTAVQFLPTEQSRFLSVVRIALLYGWDTWVFEANSGETCIELSHDGLLSAWCKSRVLRDRLSRNLGRLDLKFEA